MPQASVHLPPPLVHAAPPTRHGSSTTTRMLVVTVPAVIAVAALRPSGKSRAAARRGRS
ncbi:hypothetical protein ACFVUN_22280 [Kitasatospora griseola]|uniref:hypothetical protein n=1 Tax=Kitasatospora griseola TaxID=2064 RepID=UPI0036DE66DD